MTDPGKPAGERWLTWAFAAAVTVQVTLLLLLLTGLFCKA